MLREIVGQTVIVRAGSAQGFELIPYPQDGWHVDCN
jgi:hypothetical protein